MTPAAIKASAGAVEHLLLCPVDDLPGALSDLRIRGLRIAAAEAEAPLTADQADLRGPLAIIVGSEGQGLTPAVRRRADLAIRIPMRGVIGSLNAAVAGSILLFAAVAQRDPEGRAAGQPAPPRRPPAGGDDTASPVDSAGTQVSIESPEAMVPVGSGEALAIDAAEETPAAKPARRRRATTQPDPTAAAESGPAAKPARKTSRSRTTTPRAAIEPGADAAFARAAEPEPRPKRSRATATAARPETTIPATSGPAEGSAGAAPDDLLPGSATASPAKPRKPRPKGSTPVDLA